MTSENEKIEILWNQNVTQFKGETVLESVELTETDTGEKSDLKIQGLFMGIGHDPSTKFLDDSLELTNGYIKVEDYTKTNVPSVFVGGDVADWHYQQAITAAGWGCMAALDAEAYLTSLED
jgi:thioredoxin reductase (NADPH)